MGYNPLEEQFLAADKKVQTLAGRRQGLVANLDWHKKFDLGTVQRKLKRQTAALRAKEADLAEMTDIKNALGSAIRELETKTPDLHEEARPGWNPSNWFTASRKQAKTRLRDHTRELEDLAAEAAACKEQRKRASRAVRDARARIRATEGEIARFNTFNPAATGQEIKAIDSELAIREVERDVLESRKAEVDVRLRGPEQELQAYELKVKSYETSIAPLEMQHAELRDEIDEAEQIDRELSCAANSYERAMLHRQCEERFGKGSPKGVIGDLRAQRRGLERDIGRIQGDINRTRRDMDKTEARIKKIAEAAARDIGALIIDGKNCCFEGRQFIGLAALIPMITELANRYDVTVVFDASIRRDLGMNDDDLRAALPGATVHVVASRAKADETILDTSSADPRIWVISNDRFGDYRDKVPVKENRVIRHEILRGRVMVHDLNVNVPFAGSK